VKGTTQSDKKTEEKPKPKPVTPPVPKVPEVPQVRYVDVPGTDITVPLPSNEILATATTTATVSVAATLTATAVFKKTVSVLKPIIKKLLTKKNAQDKELPE
jgi:outer membrane biosynthesis protein TonB